VDQPDAAAGSRTSSDSASGRKRGGRKRGGGEESKRSGEGRSGRKRSRRGPAKDRPKEPEKPKGSSEKSADEPSPPRRRSRRRSGRRSGRASTAEKGGESASETKTPKSEAAPKKETSTRAKRSRSGRKRTTRAADAPKADDGAKPEKAEKAAEAAAPAEPATGAKKRRKRGTRGGRRRKKKASAAVEIEVIPGEEDELPDLADLPVDAVLVTDSEDSESERAADGKKGRGKTRSKKAKASKKTKKTAKAESRKKGKTATSAGKKTAKKGAARKSAAAAQAELEAEPKKRLILVNAGDPEETRVAVVEDARIVDLQMTVRKHSSFVSDIYRGRVVNLESAIGAAFVDFGQGRNGFLHASDVLACYGEKDWSLDKLLSATVDSEEWAGTSKPDVGAEVEEPSEPPKASGRAKKGAAKGGRGRGRARSMRPRLPIGQLLKKGQMVAVQITKDAIGDKGPTLTTYISIPGRYLVLMPSLERTGVSRKIEDERERRRLKRILTSLKIPEGMGVIVRTAGVGKTKAEIKRDLDYLLLAWSDFSKRLISGRNPAPLYQESDVAIKTMRDLFTVNTEAVVVDDAEVHQRVVDFTRKLMPEHEDRIRLHNGSRPLFHANGVEQDFEKIFSRRVELPSGGSIVIDQTEALVAIDVNSGRTREKGAEFEDIALKTNLEAVPEIARQIRLRDLGGIIVLDFIDMMRSGSRRAVEVAIRTALKTDRARSKIGRISQFGLLELTRQRLGPGLSKLVYETCRHCRGSGRQRNAASRAQTILRRLGASLQLKGFTTVEVRAHPETIEYLKKHLSEELNRLEDKSGRKLVLMSVPDQLEDSVLHYLRADGREVRPGGRRKR